MQGIAAFPRTSVPRHVELDEPPSPAAGQLLCRTLELGVCGTDREILHSEQPLVPAGSEFLVLGHECLARVEALGSGVTELAVGDLVVPVVRRTLGTLARRVDLLPFGTFTERGIVCEHGFSTRFWLDAPRHLFRVTPDLAAVAVLTEPVAVAEKAINEALAVQRGRLGPGAWPVAGAVRKHEGSSTGAGIRGSGALNEAVEAPVGEHAAPRVLVTGMGPIGFAAVLAAVARGWPTTMWGRDPAESSRAQLAQSFGATYWPASGGPLPNGDDGESIEELGFDLLLECTGSEQVLVDASRALRSLAVSVWLGSSRVPRPATLEVARMMRDGLLGNHVHLGTVNAAPRDFRDALTHLGQMYKSHRQAVEGLITARVAPSEALWHYEHREPQGVKTVVMYA